VNLPSIASLPGLGVARKVVSNAEPEKIPLGCFANLPPTRRTSTGTGHYYEEGGGKRLTKELEKRLTAGTWHRSKNGHANMK
jgi:hypothetical protein